MKICVFCSANANIDPDFFRMTEELGRWMAQEGHTLVYGGVNQGLMECVAKAVHEGGGRTIGVIPRIVEKSGRISDYVEVELFTVAAAATIGYHQKRVILYNMKGFWDGLVAMMSDLQARGMVRGQWETYVSVASTLEDIKQMIED